MKRRAPSDATTSPQPDALPADLAIINNPFDGLIGRLALRLDDVAAALRVSRSAIERERRAGRFPKPDRIVGRMPLWSPTTIRRWVEGGDHR